MAVSVHDRASDSMCPRFFGIFRSSCFVSIAGLGRVRNYLPALDLVTKLHQQFLGVRLTVE
jgi:hypothetical protein